MLSSPRPREVVWKQPVPQKAISSCLEFFMNPAVCVFNLRRLFKETNKSQEIRKLFRKPKGNVRLCVSELILENKFPSVVCSCSKFSDSTESKEESEDNVDSGEKPGTKVESISLSSAVLKSNAEMRKRRSKKTPRSAGVSSLSSICDRLTRESELKLLEVSEKASKTFNNNCSEDTKTLSAKNQAILPKKRVFKEVEPKDLRPKKKSPNSNKIFHDSRTILNVPGLNSEFYRRHSAATWLDSNSTNSSSIGVDGHKLPCLSGPVPLEEEKLRGSSSRKSSKPGRSVGVHQPRKNESSSSGVINSGAKYSPSRMTTKKSTELHDQESKVLSNHTPYPINSAMCLSSLPLQQQEKFLQRQTMSKAISYTINSLLSNPSSGESSNNGGGGGSNKNSLLKPSLNSNPCIPGRSSAPVTDNSSSNGRSSKSKSNTTNHRQQQDILPGLFGIKSEQDQKSFLRHLLDTSDPIPSVLDRPERSSSSGNEKAKGTATAASWSPNNRSQSKSNSGDSRPSSAGNDSKRHIGAATTKPVPHSSKSPSVKSNSSSHHFAPYPSQFHPSLVNSGFPLTLGAYDAFLRSQQDPSSAALAAAAAAAYQYQALLPPGVLSNLNSTMAAAVAASYLGGSPNTTQNIPASSSSSLSRSPPGHSHSNSPLNYSSSNSGPLNLSQRAWSGLPNGLSSGTIPVPFRAPIGDSRHSRGGSPSSTAYSRERLEKAHEYADSGKLYINHF
jgi:hypothetical protein